MCSSYVNNLFINCFQFIHCNYKHIGLFYNCRKAKNRNSEIVRLNGDKISIDTLNAIEESMCVERVECLGDSCKYYGYYWYNVTFINSIEIEVYLKKGNVSRNAGTFQRHARTATLRLMRTHTLNS